jgi:hypothetical protein
MHQLLQMTGLKQAVSAEDLEAMKEAMENMRGRFGEEVSASARLDGFSDPREDIAQMHLALMKILDKPPTKQNQPQLPPLKRFGGEI